MSTDSKVEIDTREVTAKLSFLVGKTVLFREAYSDSCTATQVLAVKAENDARTSGKPKVFIYTNVGRIQEIDSSSKFNEIMVVDEQGGLVSLGKTTDDLGIVF